MQILRFLHIKIKNERIHLYTKNKQNLQGITYSDCVISIARSITPYFLTRRLIMAEFNFLLQHGRDNSYNFSCLLYQIIMATKIKLNHVNT